LYHIIQEAQQEKNDTKAEDKSLSSKTVIDTRSGTEVKNSNSKATKEKAEAAISSNEVRTFIAEWKDAWEKTAGDRGDIDRYMSFYSDRFKSDEFNKKTWRVDKETKNKKKKWITIRISNVKISAPTKESHIEVRLNMNYSSSSFTGMSKKLIEVVKEGNVLKIISERTY
jgi:hypothetical protein